MKTKKIKIKKMQILVFAILFTLFGCKSEPLKIKIIGDESLISKTLIFDSKDTIIMKGILDSIYLSPYQKQNYTINNSKLTEFKINKKEGILNINNREFIVFNLNYAKDGKDGLGSFLYICLIRRDSFLEEIFSRL